MIVSGKRKRNLGKECHGVIMHFKERAEVDKDFYFATYLSIDGTSRNLFWVDGRSRLSYNQFGYVVVSDVTYKMNMCLPFSPFVGVNHHNQIVLAFSIYFAGGRAKRDGYRSGGERYIWSSIVGEHNVMVSHLQYADATIFFEEWNKENVTSLMCILKCFEEVSGLKGAGGLNIRSLKVKNLALLGMWWWRFRRDGGSLWISVIKSIHGYSGGLCDGGSWEGVVGCGVWNDIVKIGEEIDGVRLEFSLSCIGELGDGRDIRDNWRWALIEDGEFTVNELTRLVEEKILHGKVEVMKRFGITWHLKK
ncbi:FAR1-related sequence 5-like protein [Tanacetum coccineum]